MKKILGLLLIIFIIGCTDAGTTLTRLNGNEEKLPPELKGLKVYKLYLDDNDAINVAVLNNRINSLTYDKSDNTKSVIMLENNGRTKIIHYTEIISETNEYILIKK